jgi:hypothetical protein
VPGRWLGVAETNAGYCNSDLPSSRSAFEALLLPAMLHQAVSAYAINASSISASLMVCGRGSC